MKTSPLSVICLLILPFVFPVTLFSQEKPVSPVTKNASPKARALLRFFYSIPVEYLLTGQHNFPKVKNRNTKFAAEYIGKTPVIYSTDSGFAAAGDYDSYLARQDIVNEAIRQHKHGALTTICWHAIPL